MTMPATVDEQFAALFLKWWGGTPVTLDDDDTEESTAMDDLRSLMRLLDENGLRIVASDGRNYGR